MLRLIVEKRDEEARTREMMASLEPEGERNISAEIAAVLRRSPTHDDQLLDALGLEPHDPLVRAVHEQLANLELHGYITKTRRGWQWKKS